MKKNFLLLALLLTTLISWSQDSEIKGKITRTDGTPVSGVMVLFDRLGGALPDTVYTDTQGNYTYAAFSNFNYQVIPQYDRYHANGLDEEDLRLIRGAILDTLAPRLTPYQVIAADANDNGGISTFDMVQIAHVMLGIDERFPENTSWRFVLADHEFANENPWQVETFPEFGQISNPLPPNSTVEFDFIGIKIGDLNNSGITDLADLNEVTGVLRLDTNEDCSGDEVGGAIGATVLVANNEFSSVNRVNVDGTFSLFAPSGTYELSAETASNLWEVCELSSTLQLTGGEIKTINPVLTPVVDCPYLEVDISAPVLWHCEESRYRVSYSNQGTTPAEDAYIEVVLDPFLTFTSSSITPSSVDGNIYTFPVGDLAIGASGSFSINVTVSCEAEVGQTHCVDATIFPIGDCLPLDPSWDGASLKVNANCDGGIVRFNIQNVGADMTMPTHYLVVEDDLIMRKMDIDLATGEIEPIELTANGSTYRVEVYQTDGHPYSRKASASIEGCGTNGQGEFSLGFINQFPDNDDAPFTATQCQTNSIYIDFDWESGKQAFPVGLGIDHKIEQNTDIEYVLMFQNTGNTVINSLIIKDTLSAYLDPSSIQPGASSHPFRLEVDNQIVTIYLDSLNLSTESADKYVSRGFVSFRVQQVPDNPIGSVIESKSAVFLNATTDKVTTNVVWHTVGEAFSSLVSSTEETITKQIAVQVMPNPAHGITTFQLEQAEIHKGALQIFSRDGKLVDQRGFSGTQVKWNTREIPAGLYFYRLVGEGQILASGKIVVANR